MEDHLFSTCTKWLSYLIPRLNRDSVLRKMSVVECSLDSQEGGWHPRGAKDSKVCVGKRVKMAPSWEFSEYMLDGANSLLYFGKISVYRRAIIKETAWNNFVVSFFGAWQYQIPFFGNNTIMFHIFNNYGIGSGCLRNHSVPITSAHPTQAGREGIL